MNWFQWKWWWWFIILILITSDCLNGVYTMREGPSGELKKKRHEINRPYRTLIYYNDLDSSAATIRIARRWHAKWPFGCCVLWHRPIFIQIRCSHTSPFLSVFSDFFIYLLGRVPRPSPSLLLCDVNCYEVKLPVLIIFISIDKWPKTYSWWRWWRSGGRVAATWEFMYHIS